MLEILNQIFLNNGLLGLFVLMFLNMLVFTPPSEMILPLAGFFAYTSKSSLFMIILVSVLANLFGTYFWYFVGRKISYETLFKTNYFRKRKKFIKILAEKFRKEESYWVGVFRLFPFVRAVVSIPAGMVKMPHKTFLSYSIIGMGIWTSFWVFLGYFFGLGFFKYKLYILILLFLFLLILIFLFHKKMSNYLKKEKFLDKSEKKDKF